MDKGSGNCNEINECSSNPCKVNEDCTDLLASYNCTCKANYVHNATNDRCEGKNQFDLETSKNKIFSLLVYVENRNLCHALLWVQIAFENNLKTALLSENLEKQYLNNIYMASKIIPFNGYSSVSVWWLLSGNIALIKYL